MPWVLFSLKFLKQKIPIFIHYKVRESLTQVVLVCINFRLSVLGGLYIPGGKAPGNQMMRDQVRD